MRTITQHFDHAASQYDKSASLQERVAQHLVEGVAPDFSPQTILDLGCGTGFVTQAVHRVWPKAELTALDASPAMLAEVQRKIPHIQTMHADVTQASFEPSFDLIFSSMMLQWLSDPHAALLRWRGWLKPKGGMHIAVPVEGSFAEWIATCRVYDIENGLWLLPKANFADGIAAHTDMQIMTKTYSSVWDFLRQLKSIGAATPRPGHRPGNIVAFRRLLEGAPRPFSVSYHMLYLKHFAS